MQIEINEQTVDRQLVDAGMKSDYEEQAVRLLLFHLFCAIRYYRDSKRIRFDALQAISSSICQAARLCIP